jgi:hypothetical protein
MSISSAVATPVFAIGEQPACDLVEEQVERRVGPPTSDVQHAHAAFTASQPQQVVGQVSEKAALVYQALELARASSRYVLGFFDARGLRFNHSPSLRDMSDSAVYAAWLLVDQRLPKL